MPESSSAGQNWNILVMTEIVFFNVNGKLNAGCFRLMVEKESLTIMRGSTSGFVGSIR
jgi:hypothetical protein